ncbi:MAG: hypothetical protein ACSW8I_09140 [bacterium]
MKKIILIVAMMSLGVMMNAQNTKRYYCEVVGMYENKYGYLECNVVISFDDAPFSDRFDKPELGGNRLVKKDGRAFTSMMDAVNYMSHQGWQMLQVYCNSYIGSTHYVMYKDATSKANAVENIWIGGGRRDYIQYEIVIPLVEVIRWEDEDEIEEE